MEYDRSEIKVGLLLLAGIVLLVVFFAFVNQWTTGAEWEARALFGHVKGLQRDSPVRYAGQRVGRVAGLRFVEETDPETGKPVTRVEVTMALDAELRMTDEDVAYIDRSLTGEVVVEIHPGAGEPFEPGRLVTLRSEEVPSFASLMHKVSQGLDEMGAFAKAQKPVLEESLTNLRDALANFRDGTGRLTELLDPETGDLPRALSEAREVLKSVRETINENREPLGQTVTDARELSAKLRSDYENLQPDLKSTVASFDQVGKSLADFFEQHGPELGTTAESLSAASRQVEKLLSANSTRIDSIFEDLRRTAATMRTTVEDLERNPWKLFMRPLEKDPYTQNLYDTARSLVLSTRELVRATEELGRLRAEFPEEKSARLRAALQAVQEELARSAELQNQLWRTLKSGPK